MIHATTKLKTQLTMATINFIIFVFSETHHA